MIILDCKQLDETWWKAKCGLPSAGSFDQIVTSKGEPSKQKQKYLYQLAGELVSGIKPESYTNQAMLRGIEMESEARKYFEFVNDVEVNQVGLVYYDEQKQFSCSPDGLLEDAGLEIKCPLIHTHVGYLLENKLPTDYFQQVQGSMFVTGFNFWNFLSYYPGLPSLMIQVERDEKFIEKLKAEISKFCFELAEITTKLQNL